MFGLGSNKKREEEREQLRSQLEELTSKNQELQQQLEKLQTELKASIQESSEETKQTPPSQPPSPPQERQNQQAFIPIDAEPKTQTLAEAPPPINMPRSGERQRLLIVDANSAVQEVFRIKLKPYYDVSTCSSGNDALQSIRESLENQKPYNLILLDVMLPDQSGIDVCRIARTKLNCSSSEVPIIMMTDRGSMHQIMEAMGAGANDYIRRPCTFDELVSRINTQLEVARLYLATLRFVPMDLIRLLDKTTITDILPSDSTQTDVAVLFLDVRDFTTLSEHQKSEDVAEFLNEFFKLINPIVTSGKDGSFVNKLLGDGMLAVYPTQYSAVRSSLKMLDVLDEFNLVQQQRGQVQINIGLGINYGEVCVTAIGEEQRIDLTVVGDNVNIASRIESLCKSLGTQLLMSGSTDSIDTDVLKEFKVRYLGLFKVKGKADKIPISEVLEGNFIENKKVLIENGDTFDRAILEYTLGNTPKAKELFESYVEKVPEDKVAQHFLGKSKGILSLEKGPVVELVRDIKSLIAEDPKFEKLLDPLNQKMFGDTRFALHEICPDDKLFGRLSDFDSGAQAGVFENIQEFIEKENLLQHRLLLKILILIAEVQAFERRSGRDQRTMSIPTPEQLEKRKNPDRRQTPGTASVPSSGSSGNLI